MQTLKSEIQRSLKRNYRLSQKIQKLLGKKLIFQICQINQNQQHTKILLRIYRRRGRGATTFSPQKKPGNLGFFHTYLKQSW